MIGDIGCPGLDDFEPDLDAMITAANDRWIEANRLEQLGDEIMAERAIEMGYLAACKPGDIGCPSLKDS